MTIRNWIRKWRGQPFAKRIEDKAAEWRERDRILAEEIRRLTNPATNGFTCGSCGKFFPCPNGVVDFVALANHSPCSDGKERATEKTIGKAVVTEVAVERGYPAWKRKSLMRKANHVLIGPHFCYLLLRWLQLYLTNLYGRRY